jgi:dTMP kinase
MELKHHPFICIEGIDGVGKSTVAKRLAEAINGVYFKTPSKPYSDAREAIDQQADTISRFYFYLSSVTFASQQIARLCSTTPVVCDRYIYSTYAYHLAKDPTLSSRIVALPVVLPTIHIPDLTVLLTSEEQERQRRLAIRRGQTSSNESFQDRDGAFLALVEKEFSKMGLCSINTSAMSVTDVVHKVLCRIRGFLQPAHKRTDTILC